MNKLELIPKIQQYKNNIIKTLKKHPLKLQTLILILVILVVFIAVIITHPIIGKFAEEHTKDHLAEKVRDIARIVADSEIVIEALETGKRKEEVQIYANQVKDYTEVGFVVVMDMDLIRLSHPLPEEVGRSFYNREDASASLEGKEYHTEALGPLGMGMRVFTPVYNDDGKQIGVVCVGVSLDLVEERVNESQRIVKLGSVVSLFIGTFGAILISTYVKRTLFGLEPNEIARILEERNTVIESVHEGILVTNTEGIIKLANQEALKLMNIDQDEEIVGKSVDEYLPILIKVVKTGTPELNYEQEFFDRILIINSYPIKVRGKTVAGIATFKDKTELDQLAEQLTGIKVYTESLRAQSHEFMNKLHVISGLIFLKQYDQLDQFIKDMVDRYQSEISQIARMIKNPIFSGFLLGKLSKARELGINFTLNEKSNFNDEIQDKNIHELITITGNLIDNAFDAVKNHPEKEVHFAIYPKDDRLIIKVKDSGQGIKWNLTQQIFEKGTTTKGEGRGYGLYLTKQAIQKLNGELKVTTQDAKYQGANFEVSIPIQAEADR